MKTLYKGIMEGELNELPAFSSPEAKKLVENDIKKMSKFLGKSCGTYGTSTFVIKYFKLLISLNNFSKFNIPLTLF